MFPNAYKVPKTPKSAKVLLVNPLGVYSVCPTVFKYSVLFYTDRGRRRPFSRETVVTPQLSAKLKDSGEVLWGNTDSSKVRMYFPWLWISSSDPSSTNQLAAQSGGVSRDFFDLTTQGSFITKGQLSCQLRF